MPAQDKFARKPTAVAKAKAVSKEKASRYGTFKVREVGPPMLAVQADKSPAEYRVRFVSAEECQAEKPGGQNSIKVYATVVSGDGPTPVGERVLILYMQSSIGRTQFQEFCLFVAGTDATDDDQVAAFNEGDPDNRFYEAVTGDDNEFAEQAAGMIDRDVDVLVTRGKDVTSKETGEPTGDYFRVYRWAVVPDDEQDKPKIGG
jgi:hypothetical protein